jgi:PAS domain-containing protein
VFLLQDPYLIFNDFGIMDCNEAAVKFLGCRSKAELRDLPFEELSPEFQPDGTRSIDGVSQRTLKR